MSPPKKPILIKRGFSGGDVRRVVPGVLAVPGKRCSRCSGAGRIMAKWSQFDLDCAGIQ
jgi:hypothetical protein